MTLFSRDDWTLFRNLNTLGQKAGVPKERLAALVIKELADNALDAGANVSVYRAGIRLLTTARASRAPTRRSRACSRSDARSRRPSCSGSRPAAPSVTAFAWSPEPCSPPTEPWRLRPEAEYSG